MAKFGEESDLVRCTFCGKSQKETQKLIAGPGVYICNECIGLCNDIIEEEGIAVQDGDSRSSPADADLSAEEPGSPDIANLTPLPVALRRIQHQLSDLSQRLAGLAQRVEQRDDS